MNYINDPDHSYSLLKRRGFTLDDGKGDSALSQKGSKISLRIVFCNTQINDNIYRLENKNDY